MNVAEEVVVEELSPYKKLFTAVVPEQDLVAAATSCFHVFSSCQSCYRGILMPKVMNSIANGMNSIANRMNSIANRMNSNAKMTNLIANGMDSIANGMNSIAKGMNSITNGTNSIAKTSRVHHYSKGVRDFKISLKSMISFMI